MTDAPTPRLRMTAEELRNAEDALAALRELAAADQVVREAAPKSSLPSSTRGTTLMREGPRCNGAGVDRRTGRRLVRRRRGLCQGGSRLLRAAGSAVTVR